MADSPRPEVRRPEASPPLSSSGLLQGTLDMLILRTLEGVPRHGYGIAKRLRETSDEVILVEEGSLYPALHRLEKRGFVQSSWRMSETNRRAKFYELTNAGRAKLQADTAAWQALSGAIDRVLGPAARLVPMDARPA